MYNTIPENWYGAIPENWYDRAKSKVILIPENWYGE
jgi:hypothetical protein